MSHSLNEIGAMALRAARGAGLSWGMAEEAARSTCWLTARDLPGDVLLASLLTLNDGVPHAQIAPRSLGGAWEAASGRLCPLISGSALTDVADRLAGDDPITMRALSHPLMALPFAATVAAYLGRPVALCWADVRATTDGGALWLEGPADQVTRTTATTATCGPAQAPDAPPRPARLRGRVDAGAWAQLKAFAHRTYAPATEASRRLGAGAGLSDND